MTTYAELKADVAEWLDRDDLTAKIPTFVRMAESRLRKKIHIQETQSTVVLTGTGDTFIALPADFSRVGALTYVTDRDGDMVQVSTEALDVNRTGRPTRYAIRELRLYFERQVTADDSFNLTYWSKLTALVNDADTNPVLSESYDVYLYGTLVQAAPYVRDDESTGLWVNLYGEAERTLIQEDLESRNNQGAQQATPGYTAP